MLLLGSGLLVAAVWGRRKLRQGKKEFSNCGFRIVPTRRNHGLGGETSEFQRTDDHGPPTGRSVVYDLLSFT